MPKETFTTINMLICTLNEKRVEHDYIVKPIDILALSSNTNVHAWTCNVYGICWCLFWSLSLLVFNLHVR